METSWKYINIDRRIYSRVVFLILIWFFVSEKTLALELYGAEILFGKSIEGGLITGKTKPNYSIAMNGEPIEISKNGIFAFGFHRESNDPIEITIKSPAGFFSKTITIPEQREYEIQRIDGLEPTMVTPPEEVVARIKEDSEAVKIARQVQAPLGDFWQGFDWPVLGRITGVYGSQRILNGKARQPHYGIDIAGKKGDPIRSPASGTVTLVKDLYFSGWTVFIAHGLGVNSAFLHLESISVKPGMAIERGQVIGTMGATGRATGPHLDWRIDWQGRRIDPQLLVDSMPNQ